MKTLRAIRWMMAAVFVFSLSGNAAAFTLSFKSPTGQTIDIEIPADPQAAFDAMSKDAARLLEQAGVAADELVASVSGCLADEDGKPIIGAMVFVIQPDLIPGGSYGVTADQNGVGLYNAGVVPAFRSDLQPGCYWIPLPPSLLSSMLSVMFSATSGSSTIETNTRTSFYVMPILPGYNFVPVAQDIGISSSGKFSTRPVENMADILSAEGQNVGTSQ